MPTTENVVLAINAGSSSVKFALYKITVNQETMLFSGSLEDIGTADSKIKFSNGADEKEQTIELFEKNSDNYIGYFIDWLTKQPDFDLVTAIAHRVVHGMGYSKPIAVTSGLISELKSLISYDPEHLPAEIALLELFNNRFPDIDQVICFDTMFHQTMPIVSQMLPIPRRYFKEGIRRYGFHGLSYQYLTEQLSLLNTINNKVIVAHLGSGASLAAIKDGKSVDTSMGFTPCGGIPMSTRSGNLDPGVTGYFLKQGKLSPQQVNHLVNHESGLLGISETSSDIRQLLKIRDADSRAADAVNLFCYQISKYIGAYAAVLGGLDTLVFSGGIGEHLPEVRSQVCRNLGFLGIELADDKNNSNAGIISKGKVCVRVMHTNEALMMARLINRFLSENN